MAEWRKYVKDYYTELKKTNPHALLKDAMKGAAKEWKKRGPSTKKTRKNKGGEITVAQPATGTSIDAQSANSAADTPANSATEVKTPADNSAGGGKRKTKKRCRKSKKNAKKCK